MPFDWSQFATIAGALVKAVTTSLPPSQTDEARLRSAVSRYYYAAHCAARNRLRREGIHFHRDARDHRDVWNALTNSRDNTRRQQAGSRLRMLFDARRKADYDDDIDDLMGLTRDSHSYATFVLGCL